MFVLNAALLYCRDMLAGNEQVLLQVDYIMKSRSKLLHSFVYNLKLRTKCQM